MLTENRKTPQEIENGLVDLAVEGRMTAEQLDTEAAFIAQRAAIEAHNLKREERREKMRAFGRSILGRR